MSCGAGITFLFAAFMTAALFFYSGVMYGERRK